MNEFFSLILRMIYFFFLFIRNHDDEGNIGERKKMIDAFLHMN